MGKFWGRRREGEVPSVPTGISDVLASPATAFESTTKQKPAEMTAVSALES